MSVAVTMPKAAPRGAEPSIPTSRNTWAIQSISVLSTGAGNFHRKPSNPLTTENKKEYILLQCMKVKSESEVPQSCLTLCNPMDCSLSGSSVHGVFQAKLLEWGAISFSL